MEKNDNLTNNQITQPSKNIITSSSHRNPKIIIFVVFQIFLLTGTSYMGYLLGRNSQSVQNMSNSQRTPKTVSTMPSEKTDWKTYKDNKVGFQIDYPSKWQLVKD